MTTPQDTEDVAGDVLEYIRMLKHWGMEKEAFNKLRLLAKYIDQPQSLQVIYKEFQNERNYEYFDTYGSYRYSLY